MSKIGQSIRHKGILIFKWFFIFWAALSFLLLVLSFTDVPYYAYRYLSAEDQKLSSNPGLIVVMGGSGMPSPDGLIRSYYAAKAALEYKEAKIIIALPYSLGEDSLYQLKLMANELTLKGVDSNRISFEALGYNTHSQAKNIAQMNSINMKIPLLLVTSPEHMYRTLKTFEQAGFKNIGTVPAFETPIDESKMHDTENAQRQEVQSVLLRYNVWSYLNYELIVLKEYTAIVYYKIKGWI